MIEDNVMRIVIVGGGASSLVCANMIKLYDEKSEVLIIEKNDKLGKSILIEKIVCCLEIGQGFACTRLHFNACVSGFLKIRL